MSRKLSSFNGSPNGVIEHCVPLLSWGTLSTRNAVEVPGVDHLTANTGVRGAYSGSKPLGNSYSDLFVCKFKAYRGNWCSMKPVARMDKELLLLLLLLLSLSFSPASTKPAGLKIVKLDILLPNKISHCGGKNYASGKVLLNATALPRWSELLLLLLLLLFIENVYMPLQGCLTKPQVKD